MHIDLTIGAIGTLGFKKNLIYTPCTKLSVLWMRCGEAERTSAYPRRGAPEQPGTAKPILLN
jgi:hypothetical protein